MVDLSTKIAGTELKNPFMNASGVFTLPKNLKDLEEFGFGTVVTKSLTEKPRTGNPSPTKIEYAPGIFLNRMGLPNPGVDSFVKELNNYEYNIPIIGSATGFSIDEYIYVAKTLGSAPAIKLIEVNTSCPNTDQDIACFDKVFLEELLTRVDEELTKPYSVKLSPFTNFKDLRETIKLIEKHKAKAIVLTNTIPVRLPYEGKMYDWGQSGKSIYGLSLRNVYEASQCTDLDIIGCGGVSGPKDVITYLRNGAKAVQMATIIELGMANKIVSILENGVSNYMQTNNCKSLEDFRTSK